MIAIYRSRLPCRGDRSGGCMERTCLLRTIGPMVSPGIALLACLGGLFAHGAEGSRRWEDEVVYVVVIPKFFNGDPANDVMASRFARDRDRYEGGFWGGDLEGVRI